jgi:hypothetical protein
MTLTQKRRIEKIEQALKIYKGKTKTRLFPDGKGGFIEVPSHLTFIDLIAMCGMGKNKCPA